MFRNHVDRTLPHNHPVNSLSTLRKFLILLTLSYSGFLANFSPTGKAFGVSPGEIPNTIGYNLLGFAVGPLLWNPLSKTIGRRPVYLIGSALFLPCVVWMALSPSYACFSAARTVAGIVSSFSQTVPPATVADIFVKEVRGSKMSMYAVAVVIAPAVAPVFSGLIVNSQPWHVLFWFILGLAGLQLALFAVVVPETLWVEDSTADLAVADKHNSLNDSIADAGEKAVFDEQQIENVDNKATIGAHAGHVGAAWMPLQRPGEFFRIFVSPFFMARYAAISLPSIYYGMVFAWSVSITIVAPQMFEKPPYSFKTIPVGASFLAYGIGGVLGKWSGGIVGDKVVAHFERKKGSRHPEDRLWALLPILPFMMVACAIVAVVIRDKLAWIAYLIGGPLFFFCLSAATGVLQTYVLESFLQRSTDGQAVFIFFKSIWGFAIPFILTSLETSTGYFKGYTLMGALANGIGFLLCVGLIWKGYEARKWQEMPVVAR
ncbi:major facilitator superfamily protein [Rhodotorula toruloides]|uniref:Major facilitator superfamily protein n=1 Tax=Rhodotorula toruloides TaxID=5286 RepID=A0A511K7B1_RHOTO|nr:major facilitator superfamily protein [Rhodotorula toruloides]